MAVDGKWLILNGELYNYLELRRDLEKQGRRFRTESDTEVLGAAIASLGWSALGKCEGMWAFAMYDEETGALTLCRDRFGEKPLYYYRDESGVYFGSEPKFITALLGRRLPVNIDHIYRYLVNGYKAIYKHDHGFFVDLREVPAAIRLTIDQDLDETRVRYWTFTSQLDETMSFQDCVAGAKERLIRAVELRLRADVPLAFCMSGGVDSNALISIAKRVFSYDVHGFTITNTDSRYEEQDIVDDAVVSLGIRHTSVPLGTDDFLENLRTLVRQHDAPVYTITYFAHWLLMKSIAEHGYRISISGSAADELFSGYYDHHLAYLYEVRHDGELHRRSVAAWQDHIKPIVRNPLLQDPDAFVNDRNGRDHIYLHADQFAAYLTSDWQEPFDEQQYSSSLLRNRMLNELFHEAVPVILHEDDLNAMYFSIENRSPYLDRNLFEFCFTMPSRHLVRDGFAKAVLRESVRGIVPESVLNSRRKVGFNAPILSLLDVKDPAVREYLLDDSPVFEHVRRPMIERLISRDVLPNSESKFLFYFLTSKMFLEEFGG
jgi:asparagine synthase (glutamine-hydrolysing)